MPASLEDRVQREREAADNEIWMDREGYAAALSHTEFHYERKTLGLVKDVLGPLAGGRFLELGCLHWQHWLEPTRLKPRELHTVNISEKEIEFGKKAAVGKLNDPIFHLQDAHSLKFADNFFDVVFGCGILHHLELERALLEARRVLKPGGVFFFREPLAMNPVAWAVRVMTPAARTPDEQPFRYQELALCSRVFDVRFYYEQLLTVPAGVLSKRLFASPDNWLTRAAYAIDEATLRIAPPIGPFSRNVVIVGVKR
jgi:SAM-dependent methyltransferase